MNSQILEGPTRLILFDYQLLSAYAEEVAAYLASLDKPLDRIIVSHAHPDHWAGLEVLTRWLPDVLVYALDGVAVAIRQSGPKMIVGLQKFFGTAVASTVPIPARILVSGPGTVDGIEFAFRDVVDAESVRQSELRRADDRGSARGLGAEGQDDGRRWRSHAIFDLSPRLWRRPRPLGGSRALRGRHPSR